MVTFEVRTLVGVDFNDGQNETTIVPWEEPVISAVEEPDGPTVEEPPFVAVYRKRGCLWEWVADFRYAGDVDPFAVASAINGFIKGYSDAERITAKVEMHNSAKWLVKFWDYEELP